VYSVGGSPTWVKVRNSVAWIARLLGNQVSWSLLTMPSFGWLASHQAITKVNV